MKKITVFIMGCWDLLHVGHVSILEKARALGDFLIVGVFTDEIIAAKEYKGRLPVIACPDRIRMLLALKCVDLAVPLDNREYIGILNKYDPDILAIGEDWGSHRRNFEAVEYMKSKGGKVVRLPYTKGISATQIRQKILRNA